MIDIMAIIDRSSSMAWGWNETIKGFKDFIKDQENMEGEVSLTLAFFDHEYNRVLERVSLENINIDKIFDEFRPRGATALNDAIGKTIFDYDTKSYNTVDGRIVVIVTDGEENSSNQYTGQNIVDLKKAKSKIGWEFVMMGAEREQALNMGMDADKSFKFDKASSNSMAESYGTLNSAVASTRAVMQSDINETGTQN